MYYPRAAGERVDVWVMRKANDARLNFWGISQMDRNSALESIAATKSLWFLGEFNWEIDNYWWVPLLAPSSKLYHCLQDLNSSQPSTRLATIT